MGPRAGRDVHSSLMVILVDVMHNSGELSLTFWLRLILHAFFSATLACTTALHEKWFKCSTATS